KEIVSRWSQVAQTNLEHIGRKALKCLLEINLHNYHNYQNNSVNPSNQAVERQLADAFISHFTRNQSESDELFLELFFLLHFELLTYRQLIDIRDLDFCKRLRGTNLEVCERIIQGFSLVQNDGSADKRPQIVAQYNRFEPKLEPIHFNQLTQGTKLDVMD